MRERLKALIMKMKDEIADTGDLYYPEKTVSELETAISPQWVPVAERLPGVLLDVFVWDGNAYHIAYRREGAWIRLDGFFLRNVTHWHAIEYPLPPEAQPWQ